MSGNEVPANGLSDTARFIELAENAFDLADKLAVEFEQEEDANDGEPAAPPLLLRRYNQWLGELSSILLRLADLSNGVGSSARNIVSVIKRLREIAQNLQKIFGRPQQRQLGEYLPWAEPLFEAVQNGRDAIECISENDEPAHDTRPLASAVLGEGVKPDEKVNHAPLVKPADKPPLVGTDPPQGSTGGIPDDKGSPPALVGPLGMRPPAATGSPRVSKAADPVCEGNQSAAVQTSVKLPAELVSNGTTANTETPEMLFGWAEILKAVHRPNNNDERRRVSRLNKLNGGPIITDGQPRTNKARLLEWWKSLESRKSEIDGANDEEQVRERDAVKTVETDDAQYPFGRDATVTPAIGGSVKPRRGRRGATKPDKS